jgi:hypothetical protein
MPRRGGNWRLDRVYFLALLNPSQGQPDPVLTARSRSPSSFTGQLRLAVAAYLARFQGSSRYHSESDLRCYLLWCAERGLDPLAAPPAP